MVVGVAAPLGLNTAVKLLNKIDEGRTKREGTVEGKGKGREEGKKANEGRRRETCM